MYMRAIRIIPLTVTLLAATWLLSSSVTAAAPKPDEAIFGYWKIFDPDTGKVLQVVRLWEDHGKIIGKIMKRPPKPGEKVPVVCSECTGAQKDKPLEGLIFMWGLSPDADNPRKWIEGKVLNPNNGKVFNVELELSEDKKTVKVFGYMKLLVKVGGTHVWQRASVEDTK